MPSRRHLLRGLAGLGLGLGVARLPRVATARKKRKQKPKFNAFGCVNVGDFCQTDDQCCSGICKGRKGKRKCRAHDTGTCKAAVQPDGCGGTNVACTTSLGKPGTCGTTTGKAAYCFAIGDPYSCQTDADCQAAAGGILGPRAACIHCPGGSETVVTACVGPAPLPTM
jgi:hypothetical protein